MEDAEHLLENAGERDVLVSNVFTSEMFAELVELMNEKCKWPGVESVSNVWLTDWSKRAIISGFMRDKQLGEKRLASMPDRVTNSINTVNGIVNRPTVISCYPGATFLLFFSLELLIFPTVLLLRTPGSMRTMPEWWSAWKRFFFHEPLPIVNRKSGSVEHKMPYELLQKISHVK